MEAPAGGAADAQSPSLMAEFLCSAMVVLLLFFLYRWWEQDRIYAMREQERELDLARRPQVLRRSNSLDGAFTTASASSARRASPPAVSVRRASIGAVLQEGSKGNEMRSAVQYERQEKQERLRARAEYLTSLLESPVNDGDSDQSCEWDRGVGSDPSLMSSMGPYRNSNPLHAAGAPPGYAQRPTTGGSSVSGASRYTAQLLKRRQSEAGGSTSPVARTPSGSSPVSRSSSSVSGGAALERRPSSQFERRQSLQPGGDVHPGSPISRTSSMGSRQPLVPGAATHREGRYETEMVR